jgi:ketosteroid isomerase-like protein
MRFLRWWFLVGATAVLLSSCSKQIEEDGPPPNSQEEIMRLYKQEYDAVLRQDITFLDKFFPADFVVTNPFNQFIDKPKVIERIRGNIIKYDSYDRAYDYFKQHGNTMVVVGSETVVPSRDAVREDAGETVHRRFTEVWVWREGKWQIVARHANNVPPQD